MSKVYVIGDIHGGYRALRQCLERSGFDYEADHLISLGDVGDGWPETKQCIDELLKVKNLTYILGNHDLWVLEWMESGVIEEIWFKQGGQATIKSYEDGVPESHINMLLSGHLYHLEGNRLFVHAGIDPLKTLKSQDERIFLWDRDLAQRALNSILNNNPRKLTHFDEVYLGHTPVPFKTPLQGGGVWLMDTGAGWSGVLSMMNVETKEIFVSDPLPSLYPGVQGRVKMVH